MSILYDVNVRVSQVAPLALKWHVQEEAKSYVHTAICDVTTTDDDEDDMVDSECNNNNNTLFW